MILKWLNSTTKKDVLFEQEQRKAQKKRQNMLRIKWRITAAKAAMENIQKDVSFYTDGAIDASRAAISDEKKLLEFQERLKSCSDDKRDTWKAIIHIIRSSKISNENDRDKYLEVVDSLKYQLWRLETKIDQLEENLAIYEIMEEEELQYTEDRKISWDDILFFLSYNYKE